MMLRNKLILGSSIIGQSSDEIDVPKVARVPCQVSFMEEGGVH